MKKLAAILIFLALLLSVFSLSRPVRAQGSKWTFMVYLDADNDLEDVGIDNFLSMAKVGSTSDVNIVVQFDRTRGYDTRYGDWNTTKRFLVEKDMVPTPASALQDIGEQDMANPSTLSSFVTWAASSYPADHYFLDIWDHGLGWEGVALDEEPPGSDVMSAVELGSALQQIKATLGRPLDILANDACRMTLEIMYQARQYATYLVGSEKDEPVEGWPYDTVLGQLVANPLMTPVMLARTLADKYVESYSSGSSYSVAMALVNSSALPPLVAALNNFVSVVDSTLPYYEPRVERARNLTEHYESNQCYDRTNGNDYDLYDITTNLAAKIPIWRVETAAAALQAAVSGAVLYERHLNVTGAINCVWAGKAHGLSIWYPWGMGMKQSAYGELDLSRDSLWDEHLSVYRNTSAKSVGFTSSLTLQDANQDGVNDTAAVRFLSSENGTTYVEAVHDSSPLPTHVSDSPAGLVQTIQVALPYAGFYDFFVSFRQPGGMMNASLYSDVAVNATLLIKGFVRRSDGTPLDGVSVTVRNLRTNESLSIATSQGIYAFNMAYPQWIRNGDTLGVEATAGGVTTRRSLTISYHGQRYVWLDIVMENGGTSGSTDATLFGPYWPLVLIPIIGLIAEIFGIIIVIRKTTRRPKG